MFTTTAAYVVFIAGMLIIVIGLLASSPFQLIVANASIMEILSQVNYFVPVFQMLAILQAWLVAVSVYLLYSAILRFGGAT